MKKTKTYEISIVDKTYSKIISDETKFYTSDTALELVFKLKETEYTFESAEIVLLNIDDRSLVTRPVAKVLDSFTYKLDDDVISHYGEWHGQLRFEQGETYVSSPVKFRIENDLSNDRPPQLSDVQSWVSLKRYADSLTEELKQAVLSVEGMEDTFNENETVRQSQFETSEQSRQSTFETNEIERNETFNTNESTRQENETTRQQAEQERASAELLRVGAESLRVENDSKREIEITKIKDASFIKMQNSFKNGDFSKGTENWLANYATLANINGGVKISNDGSNRIMRLLQNLDVKSSYLYYLNFKYTEAAQNYRINVRYMPNSQIDSGVSGTYSALGYTTTDNINFQIEFIGEVSSGNEIVVSNVILLNLTKIFGVGNEPSKTTLDWIFSENGYFDELTLRRNHIQQYEINQLRKAVIALGGTI